MDTQEWGTEKVTVWITKYALTSGIIQDDAFVTVDGNMCHVKGKRDENNLLISYDTFYHGNNFHTDMNEALEHAEQMRRKKIVSLEKQLSKIRNMKIKVVF